MRREEEWPRLHILKAKHQSHPDSFFLIMAETGLFLWTLNKSNTINKHGAFERKCEVLSVSAHWAVGWKIVQDELCFLLIVSRDFLRLWLQALEDKQWWMDGWIILLYSPITHHVYPTFQGPAYHRSTCTRWISRLVGGWGDKLPPQHCVPRIWSEPFQRLLFNL